MNGTTRSARSRQAPAADARAERSCTRQTRVPEVSNAGTDKIDASSTRTYAEGVASTAGRTGIVGRGFGRRSREGARAWGDSYVDSPAEAGLGTSPEACVRRQRSAAKKGVAAAGESRAWSAAPQGSARVVRRTADCSDIGNMCPNARPRRARHDWLCGPGQAVGRTVRWVWAGEGPEWSADAPACLAH